MAKNKSTQKEVSLRDHLAEKLGQPIAILCSRYAYRGTLSKVQEEYCVLADATGIEDSGPSAADRPRSEDPIGGSVTILYGAIEIIFAPSWAMAPIPTGSRTG